MPEAIEVVVNNYLTWWNSQDRARATLSEIESVRFEFCVQIEALASLAKD